MLVAVSAARASVRGAPAGQRRVRRRAAEVVLVHPPIARHLRVAPLVLEPKRALVSDGGAVVVHVAPRRLVLLLPRGAVAAEAVRVREAVAMATRARHHRRSRAIRLQLQLRFARAQERHHGRRHWDEQPRLRTAVVASKSDGAVARRHGQIHAQGAVQAHAIARRGRGEQMAADGGAGVHQDSKAGAEERDSHAGNEC